MCTPLSPGGHPSSPSCGAQLSRVLSRQPRPAPPGPVPSSDSGQPCSRAVMLWGRTLKAGCGVWSVGPGAPGACQTGSPRRLRPDFLAENGPEGRTEIPRCKSSGEKEAYPNRWASGGRGEDPAGPLTLRALWAVPLGLRRPPPSSCISEHSSSSSSSMMSDRSEPRLLSVWYSSPWQQCGWAGGGQGEHPLVPSLLH